MCSHLLCNFCVEALVNIIDVNNLMQLDDAANDIQYFYFTCVTTNRTKTVTRNHMFQYTKITISADVS